MFHLDDTPPVRQIALLHDAGFGVDGVAMKNGKEMADVGVFERLNGAPANVGLAHPDHKADHDWTLYQPLAMLCPRCKMLVDMHRMLVHAQQAEESVVELSDGAAGPVPECLARFQIFEIAPVI